jgi:muramoyltetrapeptide carboxypeptidase LdcA involved in peptidoglycan recycling
MELLIGDKIGMISPSSPITFNCPKRFERAKKFIESKGFTVVEGKLTGKTDYYRSGSIKERVDEINSFIEDDSIKCIMSSIGGMNSNSLLPYINYEKLKQNPKIIIGYSDFTAILLAIYKKTGITTYYGPALVATFGELEPFNEISFEYLLKALHSKREYPIELNAPKIWTEERIDWETQNRPKKENQNKLKTLIPGIIEGRLIGGNLNTIQGIFGTEYMPEILNGDILFIEDSLKSAAEVERSFSLLKCAGVFEKVSGIIYGKHELFDDQNTNRKPYEILMEVIGNTKIPILSEFDCSHTHPMFTLPIGSRVLLNTEKQIVTIIKEQST